MMNTAQCTLAIPYAIPRYRVSVVKESESAWADKPAIHAPADVHTLLAPIFADMDREALYTVLLDSKNRILGLNLVSLGILDSSLVHPREVFKPAIVLGAAAIILAHNHPSGDPTPSAEDKRVTERIAEVGKLIGIDLLDHVVIGDTSRWVSLKERGVL